MRDTDAKSHLTRSGTRRRGDADVGPIHWRDEMQMLLAYLGGAQYRPHFYQLKLEGSYAFLNPSVKP